MEQQLGAIQRYTEVYYNTYANLPTANVRVGSLGFATDRLVLYRWSGSAWQEITIHSSSGTAAAIPTAADLPDGSIYYETDTAILKQVQSSSWVVVNSPGSLSGWLVGDILNVADDSLVAKVDLSYVKVKEIGLASGGTIRVKFDLRPDSAPGTAYGRIYRNGGAVGTEQSEAAAVFDTKSEDIAGWSAQDLLQLYIKQAGGVSAEAKNLQLSADKFHIHTVVEVP